LLTVDIINDVLKVIKAGNYMQLVQFSAFGQITGRGIVALSVLGGAIFLMIVIEYILYKVDKRQLTQLKIRMLSDKLEGKEKFQVSGFFNEIFGFFSERRKKGMEEVAKVNQQKELPFGGRLETKKPLKSKTTKIANGLSELSREDLAELKDAYALYRQCMQVFDNKEIMDVMAEQLDGYRIVTRLAQDYIEDEVLNDKITACTIIKVENPVVCIIAKPEIGTPRTIKFLVLVSALFGELFLCGFFYNTDSESSSNMSNAFGQFIISCIASALLMVPFKIIICVFLDGLSLSEDMTRKEIEMAEYRLPYFRMVGFVLSGVWCLACIYGIVMYIMTFSEFALEDWASMYFVSFLLEIIVLSQVKVALKVLIGYILLRCSKSPALVGTVGQCLSLMVDFSSQFL
jgi:hypothetical protein